MTTQSQHQVEDDEISLIDILLLLKGIVLDIIVSTIVYFLIRVAYFFAMPKR